MRAGTLFLLVCTCIEQTQSQGSQNATNDNTTTSAILAIDTTATSSPTAAINAMVTTFKPQSVGGKDTQPGSAAGSTAAPGASSTTVKSYVCFNGTSTCIGNESCVSKINVTCPVNNDKAGCYLKTLSTASFILGCTAECKTDANTDAEWCCQGNKTCVLGPMPAAQNAENSGGTVSFVALVNASFAALVMKAVHSYCWV